MKYCTRCGRRADNAARYCTGCAAPFPPPAAAAAPAEQTRTVAPLPGLDPGAVAADFLAGGPDGPRPARAPGRRTILIAAAVVVVAALAGVAAWQLAAHHGPAVATGPRRPAGPAGQPRAAGSVSGPAASAPGSPPASSPSASSPSAGTGPATTPAVSASPPVSPAPPGSGPSGLVAIGAGAAGQAGARPAAAFLASYFTAINRHDYHAYAGLFDPDGQLIPTASQFRSGYRSTVDSDVTLAGLSADGPELAATVTFRSHQNPADSATRTACTSWRITLYLEPDGSSYLIGPPPPGYHPSFLPCS